MYQDGNWLSLVEYSHLSRISISTLRGMIKRNELKVMEDNGRYLIYSNLKSTMNNQERELLELKLEVERLRSEMKTFVEENNELRMLVDLYESGQMLSKPLEIKLPELPL